MKIALVVQRYGIEVNGGAEVHCRWLAERLAKTHDVTVLTTCAKEYVSWKNEYPEGSSEIENVTVRRFPVDFPRDNAEFSEFSNWIFSHSHTRDDEIQWMRLQGPYSSALIECLGESREHFDIFIFFTYLYATTYFGLPMVAGKAWLVPTAHDERPIWLPLFRDVFELADFHIFSTNEEKQFVERRFPEFRKPSEIIGIGVNVPTDISADRFLSKPRPERLGNQLLIYVGRVDPAKGCGELFDYFLRYRKRHSASLSLLVAGHPVMPIPTDPAIVPLGFVSETEKCDAIAAATLLINPSQFESLSLSVLEAWTLGKPVLVNGNCRVLEGQCQRSQAGLWYRDYSEFEEGLSLLLENPSLRDQLGFAGARFVEENYSWPVVIQKFERLFQEHAPRARFVLPKAPKVSARLPQTVYIIMANCEPHDAVSNDAMIQYRVLRAAGYNVRMYAGNPAPHLPEFVRQMHTFPRAEQCGSQDVLLYHYSIGWPQGTQIYRTFPGKRILKYHSVTPENFFEPYNSDYYRACAAGRKELRGLAEVADGWILADSHHNASELIAQGGIAKQISILAPFHQIEKLHETPPDPNIMKYSGNGRTNLLFVGRVAPNKGHRDLIRAFAYYSIRNPEAQLLFAGTRDPRLSEYHFELDSLIQTVGLTDRVKFFGEIKASELRGLYEIADVFVCASEHEGFCIPIIEAMSFQIPVVACRDTAVRESLEGAGMWWPEPDPVLMAEGIDLCVSDPSTAETIKKTQEERYRTNYTTATIEQKFLNRFKTILDN